MPHFIIHCSQNILQQRTPDEIMNVVYNTAESTGLFTDNDIKVRIQPFQYYKLGENKDGFIHIFTYIMEGRSKEQKSHLSRLITTELTKLFSDVSFLSVSIDDFDASAYCNKSLINPDNTTNNRHFEL